MPTPHAKCSNSSMPWKTATTSRTSTPISTSPTTSSLTWVDPRIALDRGVGFERLFVFRGGAVRVLGVDPGLTRCGLGVVDGGPGRAVSCVAVHVVQTPPDAVLGVRLIAVAGVVEAWIAEHRP